MVFISSSLKATESTLQLFIRTENEIEVSQKYTLTENRMSKGTYKITWTGHDLYLVNSESRGKIFGVKVAFSS